MMEHRMQDLTGHYPAYLVPTSQEGGNMVDVSMPKNAMTAPGSMPATPLPSPAEMPEGVPGPAPSGPQLPVSSAPHKPTADRVRWAGQWAVISGGTGKFREV